MADKVKTVFRCSTCGFEAGKWSGKCPGCEEWNTLEETIVNVKAVSAKKAQASLSLNSSSAPMSLAQISSMDEIRLKTGISELDRVLGGGLIRGSLVLLGGDPGIGKSTILLQICQYMGQNATVLYVSGEESQRQIKLRADRLSVDTENLMILCETDVHTIIQTAITQKPSVMIVDSIQTMNLSELSSSAGSVVQVRECTSALMKLAKSEEIPVFVVGHVNKDGAIAGPKVLEHIVDTVLYFEGERNLSLRILRAVKNRFGSTNEIGVFDMREDGLAVVENPSQMLIGERPLGVSGNCITCILEGARPVLVEVQALASKSGLGTPRRTTTGFDYNRAMLILAVLERRAGFFFGNLDVYINIVGGLKLDETAADLSVALAMASAVNDQPIRDDVCAFGEIGLAGEVRSVAGIEARICEAARMGFTRCIVPKQNRNFLTKLSQKLGIDILPVSTLKEAFLAVRSGH